MANICINHFYCSTDKEENFAKIIEWLADECDCFNVENDTNWIRGSFDSR